VEGKKEKRREEEVLGGTRQQRFRQEQNRALVFD
jgi:hypothetical protein